MNTRADRSRLNTYIYRTTAEVLQQLAIRTGLPKIELMDQAIQALASTYGMTHDSQKED